MWSEILHSILKRVVEEKKHYRRIQWKELCQNPYISYSSLYEFKSKCIYIQKNLYLHPQFPFDSILENKNYVDWIFLSHSSPIQSILHTLENFDYHWKLRGLCMHPEMTPEIMYQYIFPYLSKEIIYSFLQHSLLYQHENFSLETLKQYPYQLRNLYSLSRHPHFNISWFNEIPLSKQQEFDWKYLSKTMDICFIQQTFHTLSWSIQDLSNHPQLPFSFIWKHRKKKWDWDAICVHISLYDAWRHRHVIPLRFQSLSKNINMRPWFIREFLDKKWDRIQLAINPSLRPKHILQDPILFPMWRWDHVFKNPSLDIDTCQYLMKQLRFSLHIQLFQNHFQKDEKYIQVQKKIVQTFLYNFYRQKQCKEKIKYLIWIHHQLPNELWQNILKYV